MKKTLISLTLLSVLGAHAMAHEAIYYGTFSGSQEVPSTTSFGSGHAKVTIDLDTATMLVECDFVGLTGNVTASHIHFGNGPGTNGGVATPLPSFPAFPQGGKFGTYSQSFDMSLASSYNPAFITNNGGSVGTAYNAFLTKLAEGKGYWNVHSSSWTGGEIRANLTAVPEPATMMAVGAGALALIRRKKSSRP